MPVERRRQIRQKLYSPEYFDFDADNGGILTDLSESGAGFQAVSPVEKDQIVSLSFTLGSGYRIEAQVRVIWVGGNGNSGGAAFLSLHDDSGSILREWLNKLAGERNQDARASAANESHSAVPLNEPIPSPSAELMAAETGAAIGAAKAVVQTEAQAVHTASAEAGLEEAAQSPAKPAAEQFSPEGTTPRESSNLKIGALTSIFGPLSLQESPVNTAVVTPKSSATSKADKPSFSAIPSIGAWAKAVDTDPSLDASRTPRSPGALLPPDAAPIFSRRTVDLAEDHDAHGSGKKIMLVIIFLLITAGIVWYRYYPHPWLSRQTVGEAIVHFGNKITGASNPAPVKSPSTKPPSNAQPSPSQALLSGSKTPSVAPPAGKSPDNAVSNTGTPAKDSRVSGGAASPASPSSTKSDAPQPLSRPAAEPKKIGDTSSSAATKSSVSSVPPETKTPAYLPATGPASSRTNSQPSSAQVVQLGGAEYRRAEQYLNGKGVAADPAEAAQWFWRSLEAGNTDAAIPLADLYLQGKGVNRSCVQARVLLNAAAAKGNAEAIRKLGQLPETCE